MIEIAAMVGLFGVVLVLLTKIYYKLGRHDILLKFIIQKIDLKVGCDSSMENKECETDGFEDSKI